MNLMNESIEVFPWNDNFSTGIPLIDEEHKNSHNRFVADLIELKSKKDHVSVNETLKDVLSFLTHWLAFHILESDKHMSKVALGLQSGMTLTEAKLQAAADM